MVTSAAAAGPGDWACDLRRPGAGPEHTVRRQLGHEAGQDPVAGVDEEMLTRGQYLIGYAVQCYRVCFLLRSLSAAPAPCACTYDRASRGRDHGKYQGGSAARGRHADDPQVVMCGDLAPRGAARPWAGAAAANAGHSQAMGPQQE